MAYLTILKWRICNLHEIASCLAIIVFLSFFASTVLANTETDEVDPSKCLVFGPGLISNIVLPARYFFIETYDFKGKRLNKSPTGKIRVDFNSECRLWHEVLDLHDGSLIVRYRLHRDCSGLKINIMYNNHSLAKSPYILPGSVHSENCNCPEPNFNLWMTNYGCPLGTDQQILNDLDAFPTINFTQAREEAWTHFDRPNSMSICNYVVKDNQIYRRCLGAHVGFKMFWDNILLSFTRKVNLPDMELLVNLGDWPLVRLDELRVPMLSWCGSNNTADIVVPTYEITEATLECMGRVTLDILSVQGSNPVSWEDKKPMAFWRGRDSSRERLNLIELSREHTDLLNASLTNFFFFRDLEDMYGPKVKHVSFFKFFDFKYQINLDGTVAAYRFPFLLAGGSTVFKQESQYYEHFYSKLRPWIHFVPVAQNLSDLVEKLRWARENDQEAREIAKRGQLFAQENLMPKDIFCYYGMLFRELRDRTISPVIVMEGMERVEQPDFDCDCSQKNNVRDEL